MTNKAHQIGRRQFLIASSTCAVAAVTVGPKLFASAAAGPVARLAIGFSPAGETADVFAAAAVPAADGGFISRGARVTVSGSSGAGAPAERRVVDLLAHFSVWDGARQSVLPFRAWASSRATGTQGGAGSFNMPVDEQQKLVFSIESERGNPSGKAASRRDSLAGAAVTESRSHPVVLSLQNEPGALKLARGSYVVVPLFDGDSDPDWSSFQLRSHNGRLALHGRDGAVVAFDHFVLSVDYAAK